HDPHPNPAPTRPGTPRRPLHPAALHPPLRRPLPVSTPPGRNGGDGLSGDGLGGDGPDTIPDLPAVAGAHGPGPNPGPGHSGPPAVRWRRWRRTRPFWGGAFVIAGATVTLLSERAPLPLIVHIGIQGMASYLVPVLLLLCGLLLWFNPAQKTFYSIVAVLLALGSWITSNLGGFFIGMLSGVIGGSLAFGWDRINRPPATRP